MLSNLTKPEERRPATGRWRPWRRAFTLIEVMAATAVMALSLGTGIIALQIGMRNLELARVSTAASQLLQNEAERLRLLNWAGISALPASAQLGVPSDFANATLLQGRVTFTRSVADATGFTDMKDIVLRADWTSLDGRPHERVFRLRYSKGGLHDYYYGST